MRLSQVILEKGIPSREKNKKILLTLIKKKIKLDLILVDLRRKTLSPEAEIEF